MKVANMSEYIFNLVTASCEGHQESRSFEKEKKTPVEHLKNEEEMIKAYIKFQLINQQIYL